MIEINEIFSDNDKRIALWCDDVSDTNDLALMADYIIKNKINLVSVPAEIVEQTWAYLEKNNVNILTRFDFAPIQKNIDNDMNELAKNIVSTYKKGANGIQIFLKMRDFERFVDALSVVRDDLFFEHLLSIVLDVADLEVSNWEMIFQKLRDIRADSFGLILSEDIGNRSDFVGRVYGMLNAWDTDAELYFILNNNYDRMDQAIRLIESEKPELADKVHFFLDY